MIVIDNFDECLNSRLLCGLLCWVLADYFLRIRSNAGYKTVTILTVSSSFVEVPNDDCFLSCEAALQDDDRLVRFQKFHHWRFEKRGGYCSWKVGGPYSNLGFILLKIMKKIYIHIMGLGLITKKIDSVYRIHTLMNPWSFQKKIMKIQGLEFKLYYLALLYHSKNRFFYL